MADELFAELAKFSLVLSYFLSKMKLNNFKTHVLMVLLISQPPYPLP